MLAAVGAMAAPLVDHVAAAVPAGLDLQQVERAIIFVMNRKHWVVERRDSGELVAVLSPRDHVLKVRIAYGTNGVTIDYLDSTNLDYKEVDGRREIHPRYNLWISGLVSDISNELQKQARTHN